MSKIIPLTKNHKNYDDVPDGLKWAIPIHECLEKPEVKEASHRLEQQSKNKIEKEFLKKQIKLVE
jgi:hypothetical protein